MYAISSVNVNLIRLFGSVHSQSIAVLGKGGTLTFGRQTRVSLGFVFLV